VTTAAITVTPGAAADAYNRVASGAQGSVGGRGESFGGALQRAIEGAIDAGHNADAQSTNAILGKANLTDVVTAVAQAQLALQTTVAIRDRVVQAYQDIMRMPI
jgi:flagellar hook-basal body complex protein FliE